MRAMIRDGESTERLEGIRGASLRRVRAALLVVTSLALWYFAAFPTIPRFAPLLLSLGLALTWVDAVLALRAAARVSAVVLVAGLLGTVTLAMGLYPDSLAGLGFSPIVVVALVLLGPWSCLATATLARVILVLAGTGPAPYLSTGDLAWALAFAWGSFALAGLFWQPIDTMLRWSWQNVARSQKIAEQLRDRQAELSQTNRSLSEAYSRAEELLRDLDAARRADRRPGRDWLRRAEGGASGPGVRMPRPRLRSLPSGGRRRGPRGRGRGARRLPPRERGRLGARRRRAT